MGHERWSRAYTEAPEIFDAFCRAEDPDGRVTSSLRRHAGLEGREILEIGCGTGRYTTEWARGAASYVGLERSLPMLELARHASADVEWICGDATRLPFADETFDAVVAGWLVGNLRPASRQAAMREALRVLRHGARGGLWLIENHWSGEFHELRGLSADDERTRVEQMMREHDLAIVERIDSELRFPSADEARRILGWLCGDRVGDALRDAPTDRVTHHVMLLYRSKHASAPR